MQLFYTHESLLTDSYCNVNVNLVATLDIVSVMLYRPIVHWYWCNGVATNFGVGVGEARPEGPRVGDGILGRGQPVPPHQLGGLQERCKVPQRGPGQSPGRLWVFLYSGPSDCLSQHLSIRVAYSLHGIN